MAHTGTAKMDPSPAAINIEGFKQSLSRALTLAEGPLIEPYQQLGNGFVHCAE
jgi:hypothetical protein